MFIKIRKDAVFIVLLLISCSVNAGGIVANYGYGLSTSVFQTKDPASPRETVTDASIQPLHFMAYAELSSTSRLLVELFINKYDLEAPKDDTETVHFQTIDTGLNFIYQEEIHLSSSFRPILGAGLAISRASFTGRHTENANGNTIIDYDKIDKFLIAPVITAGFEVDLADHYAFGARLLQSFGADIKESQAMLIFIYKPKADLVR